MPLAHKVLPESKVQRETKGTQARREQPVRKVKLVQK